MSERLDAPETGDAGSVLVIGVGNEIRGDDAVGLLVARQLAELDLPDVVMCEHDGEPASLMELWRGAQAIILIDAVAADAEPGSILTLEANTQPLPAAFFRCSSHAFGIAEAVELMRALGELPQRVVIVGIVGLSWEPGSSLSPAVAEAIPHAEHVVLTAIDQFRTAAI